MLSRSSHTTSHRFEPSISDKRRFAILSPPLLHALGSTHSRADLSNFYSSVTASLRSTLGSAFSSSHAPLSSTYASSPMSRYAPQSSSYASRTLSYAPPASFYDCLSSIYAPPTSPQASQPSSYDPRFQSYAPPTSTLPEDYAPLFYRSHHSSLTSGSLNGSQVTTAEPPTSLRSPDIFTGRNPAKLIPFISQCILWFIARPYGFLAQRDSVLFASSYLCGPAGSWWMNVLAEYPLSPLVDDWYLFTTQLFELFGTRNLRQTAQRALLNMKMSETAQVTEYIITFNSYVPYAGWNDSACVSQFYRGLANRLKDMFQYVPRPQTLVDMQDYVMEFDHRYWERRAEEEFAPTEYSTSPAPSSPLLLPRSPLFSPRSHSLSSRSPLFLPRSPSLLSPTTLTPTPSHSFLSTSVTTPVPLVTTPAPPVHESAEQPIIFTDSCSPTPLLTPTPLGACRRRLANFCNFCGVSGHNADTCLREPVEQTAFGTFVTLEPPLPFEDEEED